MPINSWLQNWKIKISFIGKPLKIYLAKIVMSFIYILIQSCANSWPLHWGKSWWSWELLSQPWWCTRRPLVLHTWSWHQMGILWCTILFRWHSTADITSLIFNKLKCKELYRHINICLFCCSNAEYVKVWISLCATINW